jgi:hypothetical protein
MAGDSATPLPRKLGIREGHRVAVVGAPARFVELLGPLPAGATVRPRLAGTAPLDVIVVFVAARAALASRVEAARTRMAPAAGLWIAWPKKSSGIVTDMTEHAIRDIALPTGLVDNKVCAIDETWSALRLVIRRELRPATVGPPRTRRRASAR